MRVVLPLVVDKVDLILVISGLHMYLLTEYGHDDMPRQVDPCQYTLTSWDMRAAMSDMSRRAVIAWLTENEVACDGDGIRRRWRKDHGYGRKSRKSSKRGRSTPTACATIMPIPNEDLPMS